MDPEEILEKAREMERDAIKIYTEMKKSADHETIELLDYLINQEKEHLRMISERLKAIKIIKRK
ncbi:ferritin family protein [Geoglobus acetivorans]|uniref:Rubrerythrin family protein n=1 Tax=Geoglobus acetivorans TaxID=565033 RepID=A0ABZ3H505_GEOAI|nr:rubrerythrin family protein [Geoglobus acetivorans]